MVEPKLSNYLRAHRKRSGLSQHEVASIAGWRHGGVVSRYEWGHRLPSLRAALGLAVAFRVPVEQLFSGLQDSVEEETEKQLLELEIRLQSGITSGATAVMTAKKLVWLTERKMNSTEDDVDDEKAVTRT